MATMREEEMAVERCKGGGEEEEEGEVVVVVVEVVILLDFDFDLPRAVATVEVVTANNGMFNIFVAVLYRDRDMPTAARGTAPSNPTYEVEMRAASGSETSVAKLGREIWMISASMSFGGCALSVR